MARLSKARITDEESYDLALAEADEERLTLLTESLEGTFHSRQLAEPTLKSHARTKKLWALFQKRHALCDSLPAEIVPGAELPSHDITKEFVRWLGVTLRGRLERFVVKKTIESYIFKFFALWRAYAFLPIPKDYRNHVMSYFYSEEFDQTSKLSTKARVKETANIVDVEILVKGVLEDKKYFRTHRARWDTNYSILLSALSSERPGAMIESGCYRHSNESMTWDDHEFWVIPNPQDPHRPFFCCVVRIRLLKGHRKDDSFMKYFFLLPEPASHRHVDALMYLVVNAFKDAIFVDVETPEQVFFPKNPCHTAHKLRIKESAKHQAVTRREVYQDGFWTTSDTLAMPYFMIAAFLRKISLFLGFVIWFTFYCFRRCSANNMNAALPDSERIRMMGQNPNSHQFFESYQSRLAVIDLGAILSERHEANEENTNMMKAVCGMSKGRDTNAPISLDAAEVNELLDDPELVEFRRAKGKLHAQVNAEITKRASIDKDDDAAIAAQNEVINALRMKIRTIDREHRAIVTRETYALVALKRKKYFDEASFRILNNIQPEQRVPLATKRNIVTAVLPPVTTVRPGQENTAPGAPAPARRARVSRPTAPDPLAEAVEILYNFTPDDVGSAHFVASVNALLGLPERPSKHCYPGESPTHDDKCPVCGIDCIPAETNKGGGTVATHIHKCTMRQLKATVQQQVEAQYKPTTCLWTTCGDKTVFATRTEFCAHIIRHLENLRFASSRGLPGAQCMWKTDDEPCGERNCEDLDCHFALVHDINVQEEIAVEYCAICSESFIDFEGDGALWDEHSVDHYAVLFLPFDIRVQTPVDFTQHGVIFTSAVDHCIQFENGEGFGGERPEFHGHLDHQVPLAPMFCPICVYDRELPMPARMKQFCRNQDFQLHLSRHQNEIVLNPDELRECPVPSCGTHLFDAHDFLTHLVVFHRVPICGSTNHTKFRRLRLPSVEELQPVMQLDPVDLAHLHDDTEAPPESGPVPSGSGAPAVKKPKRRYTPANPFKPVDWPHKCEKHRAQFRDIREHIPAHCTETKFKIRDRAMKRGQFGPFYNFAEWCATAPAFVPSEDAADDNGSDGELDTHEAGPSKKARIGPELCQFKCSGCKKEFMDIVKHLNAIRKDTSKCKQNRFRVRLADGSFSAETTLDLWRASLASAAATASSA